MTASLKCVLEVQNDQLMQRAAHFSLIVSDCAPTIFGHTQVHEGIF